MNLTAIILLVAGAIPLTPVQQQEVNRLERTLMAPCCYTQTISEHQSDVAEQMREEVESMVAAGKTDEEIKNYYRAKYGETILVVPEGRTGRIAYGAPIALSAVGMVVLIAWMRRNWRKNAAQRRAIAVTGQNTMIERIRRELGEREMGEPF